MKFQMLISIVVCMGCGKCLLQTNSQDVAIAKCPQTFSHFVSDC